MPKLKSNKGAAKRFKVNGSGKVRFRRANRNHILTKQPTKRKAQKRMLGVIKECDAPLIKRLLTGS